MPLIRYEDARPWAKAIKEEVLSRRMPPWGAVKGFGDLRNDCSLTQQEILRIAEWVEGGAPEGDPTLLPEVPANRSAKPIARYSLRVRDGFVLPRTWKLDAIRPLSSAASVQITAERPDGSFEPLLWLKNYQQKWRRIFEYRAQTTLPAGTRLHTSIPFEFEILAPATSTRLRSH
jgi:hypothetical protein